jgi:hypothetical protein
MLARSTDLTSGRGTDRLLVENPPFCILFSLCGVWLEVEGASSGASLAELSFLGSVKESSRVIVSLRSEVHRDQKRYFLSSLFLILTTGLVGMSIKR